MRVAGVMSAGQRRGAEAMRLAGAMGGTSLDGAVELKWQRTEAGAMSGVAPGGIVELKR
jgi:hypothetical protein